MQRVMFHSTVFGPIHSRRLGTSLGINLSPDDGKTCTFDCLYCEAGYNAQGPGTTGLPSREKVRADLEAKLIAMRAAGQAPDVITFSGNGEPTMHPCFEQIVDDTIALRDKYFPDARISVLSNSTLIGRPGVAAALSRVDNNLLKLDSAIQATVDRLDRPTGRGMDVDTTVRLMAEKFGGRCIVQTMLLRGSDPDGRPIDNTTLAEVDALADALVRINPRSVMLYSIDRPTPCTTLTRVDTDTLEAVARRLRERGLDVSVTS